MSDHEFRATLPVKDATEAEQVGREACDAYFGDKPYRMDVSTDAIVTVGGQVRGYKADVYAVAGPDEHRTPPDDGEWWTSARPLLWERLVRIQEESATDPAVSLAENATVSGIHYGPDGPERRTYTVRRTS